MGDLLTPLHLTIFLFEMVLPAVLAHNMAARRGANTLLWAVVGFIAGWIGVLILWAVGGSPGQKCPACKMFVPHGAIRCGHCREELASTTSAT